MPESNQPNITATQAAYWRAQLSSDLVTDQHRREFEIWLNERPENKAAWLEINAFWTGLDKLTVADVIGAENSRVIAVKTPTPIRPNSRFTRPALAIAASLLLVVSIAYIQTAFYFADYTTAPGKQRNLILADGSTILMNTDTAISVNYSAQQRHITLHDAMAKPILLSLQMPIGLFRFKPITEPCVRWVRRLISKSGNNRKPLLYINMQLR
jgi:transmembrane sensor